MKGIKQYMRDYSIELEKRVAYVKEILTASGAKGIVFGNSGGKDCALVGIICRKATENVVGVMLPCGVSRHYGKDADDAIEVADKFGIKTLTLDITEARTSILANLEKIVEPTKDALTNIAPRLRMTSLYAVGASLGYLVAGTGNRSERTMGYFTKWGDGAYDLNPIYDLTVTEVYEFLEFLGAPEAIITKAPSAALFDGQTDEDDMGITYAAIDEYLLHGTGTDENIARIEKAIKSTAHKINPVKVYNPDGIR